MAGPPKLKDCKSILVVEGCSDLLFYAELLEHLGKHGSVFIQHLNGKEDLLLKLEDFITPVLLAEKVKIGVIVDADDNPAGSFVSVQNKLAQLTGQTIPAVGTWTGGMPDIGLFVTPDGVTHGEIETLVWRAWSANPANSVAQSCIEQYRNCMATAGLTAHSPDKGLISSLLAIRSDDDPRLGPGARVGIFNFDDPEFADLRAFLASF